MTPTTSNVFFVAICCLAWSAEGADLVGLNSSGGTGTGISADGTVIVGTHPSGQTSLSAFRWTLTTGFTGFGGFGSPVTFATGVSADGNVVVGYANLSSSGALAFRWTPGGGMVSLGSLSPSGFSSFAYGVSADGNVVVGRSNTVTGSFNDAAFRWTQAGGMINLGNLGGTYSSAFATSADGSVVVGESSLSGGDPFNPTIRAFRWTQPTGMVSLGNQGTGSRASGVSAEGSVVAGTVFFGTSNNQAFVWTQSGGMVALGTLSGLSTSARGISSDGRVVVGAAGSRGFRWTQTTGMVFLEDWLTAAGAVVTGWQLGNANATNVDGSVVVGDGVNPNGRPDIWIARASNVSGGNTGNGLIGMANFSQSLASVSGVSQMAGGLSAFALHGAHHRNLFDMAMPVDSTGVANCAWISGDYASDSRRDARSTLAEAGLCRDFLSGKFRAGLGVGKSSVRQELMFAGNTRMSGEYVLAETDWRISQAWIASLTALYGRWDATVARGYLNAGNPDFSRGDTDVSSTALRGRLDWADAFRLGDVRFNPRIEYTYTRSKVDGYIEAGGGFPAGFNAQRYRSRELRLGLTGVTALSPHTELRGTVEGVHRFDDNRSGVSGQVIGLFPFFVPGASVNQNWMRAGLEIDHRVSRSAVISASLNAASRGEDANFSGSVALKFAF